MPTSAKTDGAGLDSTSGCNRLLLKCRRRTAVQLAGSGTQRGYQGGWKLRACVAKPSWEMLRRVCVCQCGNVDVSRPWFRRGLNDIISQCLAPCQGRAWSVVVSSSAVPRQLSPAFWGVGVGSAYSDTFQASIMMHLCAAPAASTPLPALQSMATGSAVAPRPA
eukprot:3933600-Rhodomonas_salina.5